MCYILIDIRDENSFIRHGKSGNNMNHKNLFFIKVNPYPMHFLTIMYPMFFKKEMIKNIDWNVL